MGTIQDFFPPLSNVINFDDISNVMEIGIGSGKWSAAFAIAGFNVTAVDNDEEILDNFITNFPQIHKAVMLVKDDVATLDRLPNKTFDLIFSEGLLEHFLDHETRMKVIFNMYKKLKPNGICICLVPKANIADDEITYNTPEELGEDFGFLKIFSEISCFQLLGKNQENIKSLALLGVKAVRGVE